MKTLVMVTAVAMLTLACTTVNNETPFNQQGMSVQGVGVVQAKPDIAMLNLSIEANAPAADEARTTATDALGKLLGVLRDQGVRSEDIQTAQFVLRFGYGRACDRTTPQELGQPPLPEPVPPPQACVLNNLRVKVRDIEKVDAVIDGIVSATAPVVLVQGIRFTVDKPEELVDEARQKALADASEKARRQSSALGIELGKVRNASTFTNIPQFGYEFSGSRVVSAPSTGGGFVPPEVQVGLFDLVVTANVLYEVK